MVFNTSTSYIDKKIVSLWFNDEIDCKESYVETLRDNVFIFGYGCDLSHLFKKLLLVMFNVCWWEVVFDIQKQYIYVETLSLLKLSYVMWFIQEPIYSFITINHQMLNYYKLFNFGYLEHPHSTISNLTMVCWIFIYLLLHQCLVCHTNVILTSCHCYNNGSFFFIAQRCNFFALSFDVHYSIIWILSTIALHSNFCPSTSFYIQQIWYMHQLCPHKSFVAPTTFLHCLDLLFELHLPSLQSSFATSIKFIVHTNFMNINVLWNLILLLQLYVPFF
jgi:hypothetical protein